MRIYYDLIVWEEVDDYDLDNLKTKVSEFAKRLQSFGILSFNMRAMPPGQQQQQVQATQEQLQEAQAQEQAQPEEAEQEVVEE